MRSVLRELVRCGNFDVQITVAGAAISLQIEFPVKHMVYCLVDGDSCASMAKTTSILTSDMATIFSNDKPDCVLIHADRYEMLAVAIAASYLNIPILHSEGFEDTGTIDDKVRYAISSLADIHFVTTRSALLKSDFYHGVKGKAHVVGSTALDGLTYTSFMGDYAVILHHPNTTDPEDITPLIEAVESLDMPKVWVNPNVDAGSKTMLKKIHQLPDVQFQKDLPPDKYINLIRKCRVLIGNTSSMIKEGAFLGIPSVLVGNRQMGRETGTNVVHSPMSKDVILEMIYLQLKHGRYEQDLRFGDGHASERIRKILEEVI
jgi:UDP-hydrolysing UDP-N-acetyl-D-glucosamine 2-epimerase